jgi:predicted nucleic acid-binding Zn ribbon protein
MTQKLSEVLAGIEGGAGNALGACRLLSLWEKVVDERVGKQTEAIKIRNRTLYVSTATPAWAQELSFLKREIVKKFNAEAGKDVIRDIKFKAGGEYGQEKRSIGLRL